MQYKKLTTQQRSIKQWRDRRNKLVCKLRDEDKMLTGAEALKLANRMMRDGVKNRVRG